MLVQRRMQHGSLLWRRGLLLIWRSLAKHNLKYIPFVGNGDSNSYKAVTDSAPYGAGEFIPKEEYIGHVTKRMGTALRKLQDTYKGIFRRFCVIHVTYNQNIHKFPL